MSLVSADEPAAPCSAALPYIKPALTDEPGQTMVVGHDDSPVVRELGNGLLVFYVVDLGNSLRYLQNRDLDAAGMDTTALHSVAMENLARLIAGQLRIEPHGEIFALLLDGNLEASLLLVDELWDGQLAGYAPNGIVAAVPARDVVAFADAASKPGVAELRALIERVMPGGDHLISPQLYHRENRSWKPLRPDDPGPPRSLLHTLLGRIRNRPG